MESWPSSTRHAGEGNGFPVEVFCVVTQIDGKFLFFLGGKLWIKCLLILFSSGTCS